MNDERNELPKLLSISATHVRVQPSRSGPSRPRRLTRRALSRRTNVSPECVSRRVLTVRRRTEYHPISLTP